MNSIENICKNCGRINPPGSQFCMGCGTALKQPSIPEANFFAEKQTKKTNNKTLLISLASVAGVLIIMAAVYFIFLQPKKSVTLDGNVGTINTDNNDYKSNSGSREFTAVVTDARAYFYYTPDYSAPKKAYLVRGDIATIQQQSNGFNYVVFYNRQYGVTTKGWIPGTSFSADVNKYTKPEATSGRYDDTSEGYDLYSGRFPEASQRYLTYEDIRNLSKYDLLIMRNEVYARHGYIFKIPEMRNYFNSQSWYVPRYDDVSYQLSKIENYNIQYIKNFE